MLFTLLLSRVSGYAIIVVVALSVGLGIGLLISFLRRKKRYLVVYKFATTR